MSLTLEFVLQKSKNRLAGLQPVVRAAAEKLIVKSFNAGIPIVITQGLRTYDEQNQLYAQGRTKPGPVVTNAKAGYSFHNFGVAIDFALLLPDGKSVSWDMKRDGNSNREADWQEVAKIGKSLGFAWGGDWKSFKDYPHLEMTFGLTTAQYRGGKKPAQSAMDSILSLIDKEDDTVTRAEYDALIKRVEAIENYLNISGKVPIPAWSHEAVAAAKAAGAITSSADKGQPELKMIQMLYNMGKFDEEGGKSDE
ncbi:Peptidoglycan L-alanyl-D-glutamate endopeptidase CwlK precursor [compost metagenome]